MLHYLWMLIVGIVVGAVARLLLPGNEHIGILLTGAIGVAGSFVGGMVGRLFSRQSDANAFQPAGFFMSVVGAVALLYAWTHFLK